MGAWKYILIPPPSPEEELFIIIILIFKCHIYSDINIYS